MIEEGDKVYPITDVPIYGDEKTGEHEMIMRAARLLTSQSGEVPICFPYSYISASEAAEILGRKDFPERFNERPISQRLACKIYQSKAYKMINESLREKKGDLPDEDYFFSSQLPVAGLGQQEYQVNCREIVQTLDTAIEEQPGLPQDVVLHRIRFYR